MHAIRLTICSVLLLMFFCGSALGKDDLIGAVLSIPSQIEPA